MSLIDQAQSKQTGRAYEFLGGYCWYCGIPARVSSGLITEHQTPKSRGGTDDSDNLVTACQPCNVLKGPRTLQEYRVTLAGRHGVATNAVVFFGETSDYRAVEARAFCTLRSRGTISFDPTPFDVPIR